MQLKRLGTGVISACVFSVMCLSPAAVATSTPGPIGGSTAGSCSFPAISIAGQTVQSQITCSSHSGGSGSTSIGTVNWVPPTCWWEPEMTVEEFQTVYSSMPRLFKDTGEDQDDPGALASFEKVYSGQLDHTDAQGKWYDWVCDADASDTEMEDTGIPDGWPWLWVDNGTTNVGGRTVLSDETLAEIAAQNLQIPDLTVNMSPSGTQTVNLATWFSVGRKSAATVSDTASLPDFGMSVTVKAVPTDLNITVSGPDAQTDPGSVQCAVNANGTIGNVLKGGGTGASACSLTFLHATTGAPDTLNASLVWEVDYTGSGAGWPRQVTVTSNPVQINVGEVQTVNNG